MVREPLMLYFLFRLVLRASVAFTLLVGAACVIGSFNSYPAWETLEQFLCSPQPCWHNLRLGMTTVQEAARILSADETIELLDDDPTGTHVCWKWRNAWHRIYDPTWDGCFSYIPDGQSMLILFYANSPLTLNDVLPLLGNPIYSASMLCTGYDNANLGMLYSRDVRVSLDVPPNVQWISRDLRVSQIVFYAPENSDFPSIKRRDSWWGSTEWAYTSPYCSG
jgi:hypothetical protein